MSVCTYLERLLDVVEQKKPHQYIEELAEFPDKILSPVYNLHAYKNRVLYTSTRVQHKILTFSSGRTIGWFRYSLKLHTTRI